VVSNARIDPNVHLDDPVNLDHLTDHTENLDSVGQSAGCRAPLDHAVTVRHRA
jgi:hypothetical protein